MAIINNIGLLRQDLIDKGWHMTAFNFFFKRKYDVLFENNDNLDFRKDIKASVTLHFIDALNPSRVYSVQANQVKMFHESIKDFREFFGIEYAPNLGDIVKQFFSQLVSYVPPEAPGKLTPQQDKEIDRVLASRGGHNPDAIYCYDARRLGTRDGRQMKRSIFISNLAQRRNPSLYKYFKNELTVTFYFSPNPEEAKKDIEIIERFIRRENL